MRKRRGPPGVGSGWYRPSTASHVHSAPQHAPIYSVVLDSTHERPGLPLEYVQKDAAARLQHRWQRLLHQPPADLPHNTNDCVDETPSGRERSARSAYQLSVCETRTVHRIFPVARFPTSPSGGSPTTMAAAGLAALFRGCVGAAPDFGSDYEVRSAELSLQSLRFRLWERSVCTRRKCHLIHAEETDDSRSA